MAATFNFEAVRAGLVSFAEMTSKLSRADLIELIKGTFEALGKPLADQDADDLASFVPADSDAQEGEGAGWTIGHIVAHLTATWEETAAVAATMARGVKLEARLRYEVPWQELNTIASIKARLQESQRMCLAFLETWPDEPHLDITATPIPPLGPLNALAMCGLGIGHAQSHVAQIAETVRQYSEAH